MQRVSRRDPAKKTVIDRPPAATGNPNGAPDCPTGTVRVDWVAQTYLSPTTGTSSSWAFSGCGGSAGGTAPLSLAATADIASCFGQCQVSGAGCGAHATLTSQQAGKPFLQINPSGALFRCICFDSGAINDISRQTCDSPGGRMRTYSLVPVQNAPPQPSGSVNRKRTRAGFHLGVDTLCPGRLTPCKVSPAAASYEVSNPSSLDQCPTLSAAD